MTALEIQAFLTIIKAGSISSAAEKLYVTQPALSRRIHSLESELGYRLIDRKKGIRTIELTPHGKAFIAIAEKWQSLWKESEQLAFFDYNKIFQISSVGSISSYILPQVIRNFMHNDSNCRLIFHQLHSNEAYNYMESGQIDFALISDNQFSRTIETIPAFREKMLVATNGIEGIGKAIHPSELDVNREIRLPWNPTYDLWHEYWFGPNSRSKVILDQMSLLEDFFTEKNTWAVVPATVAHRLASEKHIIIHELLEAPDDRIIYCLIPKNKKSSYVNLFLEELKKALSNLPILETYI